MNIFKITIATLIISQSAFANYGKAIVGGVAAGATASIVSNALSTKPTTTIATNESSNGKGGSNTFECHCLYGMYSIKEYGNTVIKCYASKKGGAGKAVLFSSFNNLTVIPLETYDREYCQII